MGKANFFPTDLVFISNDCCKESGDDDDVGECVGCVGNATESGVGDFAASSDSVSGGNGAKRGAGSGSDGGNSSNGRDGGVNGECSGEDN